MISLIIFARAPQLGVGKRRLAASLGDPQTLTVYQALLARCATAARAWPGPVSVYGCGDLTAFAASPLAALPCQRQSAGSLAQRMAAALRCGLKQGPTLLIGSDCPNLDGEHLSEMHQLLDRQQMVFGPATDGGYWAIGLRDEALVDTVCAADLPWSQSQLLNQSLAKLQQQGITAGLGPVLNDCDTASDLATAVAAGFTYEPHTEHIL